MKIKNNVNNNAITALHEAVRASDAGEVIRLLGLGHKTNVRDNQGATPLHLACGRHINRVIARALLEHGADVNAKDDDGKTALLAINLSLGPQVHDEIVSMLLAHRADPNASSERQTLMFRLARHDFASAMSMLVEAGAAPNPKNGLKDTPLHFAAGRNKLCSMRFLLACGADVNQRNLTGQTPLHMAVITDGFCTAESVDILINHGAKLEAQNKVHQTPLSAALSLNNAGAVFALIAHGASREGCPKKVGRVSLVGMTARQAAVRAGLLEHLKSLLDQPDGADPVDSPKALSAYAKKHKKHDVAAFIQSHQAMRAIDGVLKSCSASHPKESQSSLP